MYIKKADTCIQSNTYTLKYTYTGFLLLSEGDINKFLGFWSLKPARSIWFLFKNQYKRTQIMEMFSWYTGTLFNSLSKLL